MRIRLFLTCLLCLLVPPLAMAQGIAVPIGGALKYDNDEIWSKLVQLAGGKGARFAVFATAAADPENSAELIVAALVRHGAVAEHIPVAPRLKSPIVNDAVYDLQLIEKVRNSRAVYFAGGAQERITAALYRPDGQPTPMLDAIWSVFRSGGLVAGSSAGAAIMSTSMFLDPPETIDVLKNGLQEGKDLGRGLGFVGPDLFIDQHFLKRGRIGRLLPAMAKKRYRLGLGVDENTAAIIQGEQVEIIGAKGALLVDLSQATTDPAVTRFNIRNARLTYLDHGDRINLATRVVTPSPQKQAGTRIDPNAPGFAPYYQRDAFHADILGDTTIVHAMSNLIDNRQREVIGLAFRPIPAKGEKDPDLAFEFRLRKVADSLGYFTGTFGGEDYTVINIALDVTPVRMAKPLYRPWTGVKTAK